jgi:hypothetical protein
VGEQAFNFVDFLALRPLWHVLGLLGGTRTARGFALVVALPDRLRGRVDRRRWFHRALRTAVTHRNSKSFCTTPVFLKREKMRSPLRNETRVTYGEILQTFKRRQTVKAFETLTRSLGPY